MALETPTLLSSRDELLEALDKIQDLPVLVVGDLIVDRYIWGDVERISPEAPVPVLDVRRTEERLGGAGNVARNLRSVGAKVTLCALVGDDDEGRVALSLLDKDKIAHDGIVIDRNRPTTIKTRIMSQRQQIVRIDRERRAQLPDAEREAFASAIDDRLDASRALIVSDYGKGVVSKEVMHHLALKQKAKKLGLSARPFMVDPHPSNYGIYESLSLSKPNRKEAEAASGIKITDRASAFEASQILLKRWNAEMIVLSLGEDGLLIAAKGDPKGIFIDTVAQQVFDVSGAGDAVVAIFTAALAGGASVAVAGDLANIGAGVVVSEVGTVPVNIVKLKREIERLGGSTQKSKR